MKDYRLSEIKEICDTRKRINTGCIGCEMEEFCFALNPASVDIEPRDMIELPCKEHREKDNGDVWDIYYRHKPYGFIQHERRKTEAEADEFLAELKGGK